MFGLGVGEIAIILFVALIFIGPKKLPELARGLGKGIREFQNAARGLQETIKNPPASTDQPTVTHTHKDQPETTPKDQPAASETIKSQS